MTKVVINTCHGGFGLSHEAVLLYLDRSGRRVWVEENDKFGGLIPFTYYLVPPAERQSHNAAYSDTVFHARDLARDDPDLVAVVKLMGAKADGHHAELKVVDVPDDVNWYIEEYDGCEWVAERHRTWK